MNRSIAIGPGSAVLAPCCQGGVSAITRKRRDFDARLDARCGARVAGRAIQWDVWVLGVADGSRPHSSTLTSKTREMTDMRDSPARLSKRV